VTCQCPLSAFDPENFGPANDRRDGTPSFPDRFQSSFNEASPNRETFLRRVTVMLKWILILLIVAAVAGLFGMPRLAGVAASGAQILIFIVLAILLVSLLFGVIAVA
jgi:uncharacterized membrane protein YtjA (UPF0391 family)